LVGEEIQQKLLPKAGLDEEERRVDADVTLPLPTAFVLNAGSWHPVNPVSPVFSENVHSAVLLWPVNL